MATDNEDRDVARFPHAYLLNYHEVTLETDLFLTAPHAVLPSAYAASIIVACLNG